MFRLLSKVCIPVVAWAGLLSAVAAVGCSSTEQVQTAPPQPATTPSTSPETAEAERRAALSIVLERGRSHLPEAVQRLRFRVARVWLKPAGGAWTSYPADVNTFEIAAGEPVRKTVFSTQVPPAVYDSLGLSLSDVFVLYDANAGGPLTMPHDEPLVLPLDTRLQVGRRTLLHLTFEPGASLSQGEDCRWFFLPFVTLAVE